MQVQENVSAQKENTIVIPVFGERIINNIPATGQADYKQVTITEADRRRLVQSARVELSNSK